jgi:REP element-mobilizing transposase RayT
MYSVAMPSRNVVKHYIPGNYYHIYNRGVEKRIIFTDEFDYRVFMNLLKRHLQKIPDKDKRGHPYETYYGKLELLAFCLMPNHFHLFLYLNEDTDAITEMMRKVTGSYAAYFNKRHKRVGHLFQSVFKASMILDDAYLQHISRYIHLNPKGYAKWEFSSYNYYTKGWKADWVKPDRVLSSFDKGDYESFVADYEGQKEIMDELKYELANSV